MQLLDYIEIAGPDSKRRRVELLLGDLVHSSPSYGADVLFVSVFERDFTPSRTSLVGALFRRGIDVASLSLTPETNLRGSFSCWISKKIEWQPFAPYGRVLCMETSELGDPPELVAQAFRALTPFVFSAPHVRSVAMPILGAGDQGYPTSLMLKAMLDACFSFLGNGLPLDLVRIVVRSKMVSAEALTVLAQYKNRHSVEPPQKNWKSKKGVDVFVSYAREDSELAHSFISDLRKRGIEAFIDTESIGTGTQWQNAVFNEIERAKFFSPMYSKDYVASPVCADEFGAAMIVRRRRGSEIFFPLLLSETELPVHMELFTYRDCTINDRLKISHAAENLAQLIQNPREKLS